VKINLKKTSIIIGFNDESKSNNIHNSGKIWHKKAKKNIINKYKMKNSKKIHKATKKPFKTSSAIKKRIERIFKSIKKISSIDFKCIEKLIKKPISRQSKTGKIHRK